MIVPTEGEHRIPKGGLKRDEHNILDKGPGLCISGSRKKSGNYLVTLSHLVVENLRLWVLHGTCHLEK